MPGIREGCIPNSERPQKGGTVQDLHQAPSATLEQWQDGLYDRKKDQLLQEGYCEPNNRMKGRKT